MRWVKMKNCVLLAKFAKIIKIIKVEKELSTLRQNNMTDFIWIIPAIVLTLILIKLVLAHNRKS
jgi:hypothetical protein